ncbi:hypothetical protein BRD13_01275 [Halobacteriales archaeon SW_5_70_135]|nr:MAG: hypothetical protein BRD13_01275 [Halobacteriales archaeon SW_5_70_135]
MSSDAARADATGSLHDRVLDHLGSELPDGLVRQATVEAADPDTGRVALSFGCGCSGGLAPGERAAVRATLVERLPTVDAVLFGAGCGCEGGAGGRGGGHGHGHEHERGRGDGRSTDDTPEAPF